MATASFHIEGLELPAALRERLEDVITRLETAVGTVETVADPVSWSEAEAAVLLDMSEISLSRERLNGRIAFSQVGRKARYTRSHLEEYLRANTKRAAVSSKGFRKKQKPQELARS